MMLELLARYTQEHDLVAEPGFAPKAVRWSLGCSTDGRFLGVLDLADPDDKKKRGRTFGRCPQLSQPELKAGGRGCRHFLVDSAEVATLLGGEDDEKLLAKHRYFVDLLRQASQAMPALGAAVRCLEDPDQLAGIRAELAELKARATDNVTFSDGKRHFVESDEWHNWWRGFRGSLAAARAKKKAAVPQMRCFVSGGIVEPVPTHPKVRGLADVGGHSAGDVLASFKQESFRSFGLLQAANAAVSEDMATQYSAALNHLIAHHSTRLAGTRIVHWFKKHVPPDDDPLDFLVGRDEEGQERSAQNAARELLESIRKGERKHLHGNHYYVLTLTGQSGRIMVRDWIEGPFPELVESIDEWFEHLEIVRRDGSGMAPAPKFYAVLGALVRSLDDLTAPMVAKLWRVAVCRDPIPVQVLARALARVRVDIVSDEPVRHAAMGLIKAFHIRNKDQHMKPGLNEEHPSPAYQCGRLMAVLAALQYSALGDVGAGVVQRYYAAACTTPSLVLGRLVRNSQFHLEKLEPRLRSWWQKKIAGVMARIGNLPAALSLEGQSLFALGYYHQIAVDRSKKSTDTSDSSN